MAEIIGHNIQRNNNRDFPELKKKKSKSSDWKCPSVTNKVIFKPTSGLIIVKFQNIKDKQENLN